MISFIILVVLVICFILSVNTSTKHESVTNYNKTLLEDLDYDLYIQTIVFSIKETHTINEDILRINWTVIYDRGGGSTDIKGWIVNEQGSPVVFFHEENTLDGSYMNVGIVPKEIERELIKDINSDGSFNKMKNVMSNYVYYRYYQTLYFMYEEGCFRGFGKMMPYQINPIVTWYENVTNQVQIDEFLKKESNETKQFKEFLEMFVQHKDLKLVQQLCESMDVGIGGVITQRDNNLYSKWKAVKSI